MADALEYDSNSPKGTLDLAGQPSSPLVVTSKKAVALHYHSDIPHMRGTELRPPTAYPINFIE